MHIFAKVALASALLVVGSASAQTALPGSGAALPIPSEVIGQPVFVYAENVDLDGDTAVVSAFGAAYVYQDGPSGWNLLQKLSSGFPESPTPQVRVAIDGDRIAFAARVWNGALIADLRVYERSGGAGTFGLKASYTPPASTNQGWASGLRALDISGDRVVVASQSAGTLSNFPSSLYVYQVTGAGMVLEQELDPPGEAANLGFWGLSIDDDTIAAGSDAESIWIFRRVTSGWSLEQELVPSGSFFDGALDLSGDRLAFIEDAYRVDIWERQGTSWGPAGEALLPYGWQTGYRVELEGDRVAAATSPYTNQFGPSSGSATVVWDLVDDEWLEQIVVSGEYSAGLDATFRFGLSGDRIVRASQSGDTTGNGPALVVQGFDLTPVQRRYGAGSFGANPQWSHIRGSDLAPILGATRTIGAGVPSFELGIARGAYGAPALIAIGSTTTEIPLTSSANLLLDPILGLLPIALTAKDGPLTAPENIAGYGAGSFTSGFILPNAAPGTELRLQALVIDSTSVDGFTVTNAVEIVVE